MVTLNGEETHIGKRRQMKSQFPDEWLVIVDEQLDANEDVMAGRVIARSRVKAELREAGRVPPRLRGGRRLELVLLNRQLPDGGWRTNRVVALDGNKETNPCHPPNPARPRPGQNSLPTT